jgi:anaerobic magnesium-protoporphyrin IX monomethyl ester cyclase
VLSEQVRLKQLITIIFPPQFSPFRPPLGIASLKAFLKGEGIEASQIDANIGFYRWILNRYLRSDKYLENVKVSIVNCLKQEKSTNGHQNKSWVKALSVADEWRRYEFDIASLAPSDKAYSIEKIYIDLKNFNYLLTAFSFSFSFQYDMRISFESFVSPVKDNELTKESINKFCRYSDANPFLMYYEEEVMPCIPENLLLAGISVTGNSQILPAFVLASMLKERNPALPVAIGGPVFTALSTEAERFSWAFKDFFDVIIKYEGELPLLHLIQGLAEGKSIQEISCPGSVFLNEKGEIVNMPSPPPLPLSNIPTPDFSDLPLQEYFVPQVILPIFATRGCQSGKCAFCGHGLIYRGNYREREVEQIVSDIQELNAKYSVSLFAFVDEMIPAHLAGEIADHFNDQKMMLTSCAKFSKRWDKQLLARVYRGGFRSLYWGLECGSERVAKLMNKYVPFETIEQVLRDSSEEGIWNHIFCFIGFPSESNEEALETLSFLQRNADTIQSYGMGTFTLVKGSDIFKNPDKYHIEISENNSSPFLSSYSYTVNKGLSKKQVEELNKNFTEMLSVDYPSYIFSRDLRDVFLFRYDLKTLKSEILDAKEKNKKYRYSSQNRYFVFPVTIDNIPASIIFDREDSSAGIAYLEAAS